MLKHSVIANQLNPSIICAILLILLALFAFQNNSTVRRRTEMPNQNFIHFSVQSYQQKEQALLKTIQDQVSYKVLSESVQRQRKKDLALIAPVTSLLKQQANCKIQSCVALTFDDGPFRYTEHLLNILHERQAKATFFVLGLYVKRYEQVVRRIANDGHQIGNHTWSHHNLGVMSETEVIAEINQTNHVVRQVSGVVPKTARPPYGITSHAITMPQILWSVDPFDWQHKDAVSIANHVVSIANRGDIILLHDVYESSVEAVPAIVDGLRAKGLTFATIDELISDADPKGVYHHQP